MGHFLVWCALMLLLGPSAVATELVVIVNAASGVERMTHAQVIAIYMARQSRLPSGVTALPLDLAGESIERREFYRRLLGRTTAEVNAYWARLLFSGRASPPRPVDDAAAAVNAVAHNRGAIAYVERSFVDARVKVVFELAQ